MSTFLIIDYFREVDFSVVLLTRIVVLSMASALMILSFKKSLRSSFIPWGIVIVAFINFGSALVTATFASMPPFYLTNLLFLIWVLVVSASGLNLRHGLLLNLVLLFVFVAYSQWINRNPFYFTQYPHLFVSFIYFFVVSNVLEFRRRNSFIQFQELTNRKKAIEELNEQKNKIISILSHDVASPLNSLAMLLQLESKGRINADELRPFLEQVGGQLKNVTGLLSGLVRWSRSQMEGFVTDKKSFDIAKHLESHFKLLQPIAGEKSINIRVNVEPDVKVFADEEMIRVAIRSLISNAIKFGTRGTEVKVEGFVDTDDRVVIRVINEGSPFPEVQREKLFTYQMPSSEGTAGERGTGLGLAMAAFFVRFNAGEISLESTPSDNQTKFRIELPSLQSEPHQIDRVVSNFSR